MTSPADELRTAAATALAALLDAAAEESETIGTDPHALAAARAILGGQP